MNNIGCRAAQRVDKARRAAARHFIGPLREQHSTKAFKLRSWYFNAVKRDSFPIGFALGFIFPALGFALIYIFWFYETMSLGDYYIYLRQRSDTMSAVLSLSLIMNLPVFFLNIWAHRYNTARGVIFATMIYGALIIYLKVT